MVDKKVVLIGFFGGTLIGVMLSVLFASILIISIGESFKVESMNITISLNESMVRGAINDIKNKHNNTIFDISGGTPEAIPLRDEVYPHWYQSNILFAGSTFKYDTYVIKAQDILPDRVEIQVLQNGDYVFNGTCYENEWCNIKDISFQIDDIHIGKEASYLVYWSDT